MLSAGIVAASMQSKEEPIGRRRLLLGFADIAEPLAKITAARGIYDLAVGSPATLSAGWMC